jgi:nicotinamide phosphoribosyltransferase
MKIDPIVKLDGYKCDHRPQYPNNTELVYSNLTARSSRIKDQDYTVFFGLQYFVKDYLIRQFNEEFFNKPKAEVVAKYKRRMDFYLGPNAVNVDHIAALHDLGYLPLVVKAVKEGTKVPLRVPMLTLYNTKPEFFWLTNYLETVLSNMLWMPITSATTADRYRRVFDKYADETVGNRDFVQWQGHDFSMRGMSSVEAAAASGAAHLLSFTGTDTVPAIDFLEEYYKANVEKELVGSSVPASEHSVMCAGGNENEYDTFLRLITKVYPKGIVSLVSDTWDFWGVLTNLLPRLKDVILSREGKLVIRPDSGDPVKIVVGLRYTKYDDNLIDEWENTEINPEGLYDVLEHEGKFYKFETDATYWSEGGFSYPEINLLEEVPECVVKGAIEVLWDVFGGKVNELGYKELDPHIGLIYGDSITPERQLAILEGLKQKGFASNNVVLGIGSFTYTYVTRDTYGMAMKATYVEIDGKGKNIFKQPKTDDGMKNSAKGLLKVECDENFNISLKQEVTWEEENCGILEEVFRDGQLLRDQSLAEIRQILRG